jgi:hypothetical protein
VAEQLVVLGDVRVLGRGVEEERAIGHGCRTGQELSRPVRPERLEKVVRLEKV